MFGKPRLYAAALLLVTTAAAAWLRLSSLDTKSITHPEMYVPGIHLAEGISEPAPRYSVQRVLSGTFSSDTHPPGFYLLMLPWTRLCGTSLRALRLPSALLGIACIPLLAWLGMLAGNARAGLLAAALLAVNGYHVFWTRVARMFSLACFLALLATILLVLLTDPGRRRRRLLMAAYVLALLAGVATHVFFWTVIATHLLWALGNAWARKGPFPDLGAAQILAVLLGSPFLAFAAYQSGTTVARLSRDVPAFLADFLRFSFVLPSRYSGYFPASIPYSEAAWTAVRLALLAACAILFWAGVVAFHKAAPATGIGAAAGGPAPLWNYAWSAAAAAAVLAIAIFVLMTRSLPGAFVHPTIRLTKLFVAVPPLLAVTAILLRARWALLSRHGAPTVFRLMAGAEGLVLLMAILPFVLQAGLSVLRPVLNQRGMLFEAPYLLLVLAAGITSLARRPWAAAAMALALIPLHAASLDAYRSMTVDLADYKPFAAALVPHIRPDDLVFVHRAWYATPIQYYLPPDRYHLVGSNYDRALSQHADARIWVVLLYDKEPPAAAALALRTYRQLKTIACPFGTATLYAR